MASAAFMGKFGGGDGLTAEGDAVVAMEDQWHANQQPGALDRFIDKFNGVTEPYFFYNGTVELRFQTEEHIYYRVGELGQLTPQDGVTTICHIIDKSPALVPWSAKMVVAKLLRTVPTVSAEVQEASGVCHCGAEMENHPQDNHVPTEMLRPKVVVSIAPMTLEAFEKIALEAKSAPRDVLEEAGNVGHMAHTWLEYYIKSLIAYADAVARKDPAACVEHKQAIESKLANMPADPRAANCVKAALQWMKDHNVRWISTERKIYSKRYSYAGTMDGLCTVDSCKDPTCCATPFKDRLTVADWKTSNYLYIEYLYQTAAYEAAYEEEFGVDVQDRWVLRLGKEDGEFDPWHLTAEDFQEDFEGFLDALSLTRSVHLTEERMKGQKKAIKEAKRAAKLAEKEAEKAAAKIAKEAAKVARRAEKAQAKEDAKLAKKAERAAFKAGKEPTKAEADALCDKIFCDKPKAQIVEVVTVEEAVENALADNRLAGLPEPEIKGTITGRFVTNEPSFIELDSPTGLAGFTTKEDVTGTVLLTADFAAIEQRVIASLPTETLAIYGLQLPVEKVGG